MTSSLVALSFQFTLAIFLHIHIFKASSLVFSVFLMVHVSHPYSSTGQTSDFTSLFLKDNSILLSSILLFCHCNPAPDFLFASSIIGDCCSQVFELLNLFYFMLSNCNIKSLVPCFGNNHCLRLLQIYFHAIFFRCFNQSIHQPL